MPRPRTPPEPRLSWAYVPRHRAEAEGVQLPDIGWHGMRHAEPTAAGIQQPGDECFVLSPVTLWAHLKPKKRPPSYCPVCHEPVVLKLGKRLRHHYGHRPSSTCAAAGAEGALHIAAKLHLATELRSLVGGFRTQAVCNRVPEERSTERCRRGPIREWTGGWDEVLVEHTVPSLRADLMLVAAGKPVLAIEIYATHAVDELKAEKYRELGIPWIEVPASAVAPEAGQPWTPASPLPTLGDSTAEPVNWRCPRHEGLYAAYVDHQQNGEHPIAWRQAHLYRTDGGINAGNVKVDTVILWAMTRREGGEPVEVWVERETHDRPLRPRVRIGDRAAALRHAHQHFVDWARWLRNERRTTVDSPMSWQQGTPERRAERAKLYPERLRWNQQTGSFQGPPGQPSLAWPVPLFDQAVEHPVHGASAQVWRDPPVRDLGELWHATDGPCWLTLRVHQWHDTGIPIIRADFTLHIHDGRRWVPLETHSVARSERIPSRAAQLIRGAAAAVAAESEAVQKRPTRMREIVESLV